jgi:hypothetical protein
VTAPPQRCFFWVLVWGGWGLAGTCSHTTIVTYTRTICCASCGATHPRAHGALATKQTTIYSHPADCDLDCVRSAVKYTGHNRAHPHPSGRRIDSTANLSRSKGAVCSGTPAYSTAHARWGSSQSCFSATPMVVSPIRCCFLRSTTHPWGYASISSSRWEETSTGMSPSVYPNFSSDPN